MAAIDCGVPRGWLPPTRLRHRLPIKPEVEEEVDEMDAAPAAEPPLSPSRHARSTCRFTCVDLVPQSHQTQLRCAAALTDSSSMLPSKRASSSGKAIFLPKSTSGPLRFNSLKPRDSSPAIKPSYSPRRQNSSEISCCWTKA